MNIETIATRYFILSVKIFVTFSLLSIGTAQEYSAQTGPNIIVNGGFEEPEIPPGFQVFSSIPGWTVLPGRPDFEVQSSGNFGTPFAGNQHVELDAFASSGIFQDIPTEPGLIYELSFAFSARPQTPSLDNVLRISFGGNQLAELAEDGSGNADTVWTVHKFVVTGSSESTTRLAFEDLGRANTLGTYIDEVRLVETLAAPPTVDIIVSPTNITISEPAGQESFTVTLSSEPGANVTIALSSSNSQCSVNIASLSLNSVNWDTGATVLVSATNDNVADGSQACIIETAPSVSADASFDGINPDDVTVTVRDDDAVGIEINPTSLTIGEPDRSAAFNVKLMSEPSADVNIGLLTNNNECSVAPASLRLTDANWQSGVSATVTALDDAVVDGNQTCIIQTAPAVSNDNNYAGIDAADIIVIVQDNDTIILPPQVPTMSLIGLALTGLGLLAITLLAIAGNVRSSSKHT
ncbi:MAG: hypothetical protein R3F53_20345 [Gammaproteobacteria bacterium]